jgi:hypothetical protein
MKTFSSSLLLGCLVTLAVPSMVFAQENEDSGKPMVTCEQEAKDMGLTKPEDIAAYVKECEDANSPGDPSDQDQQEDPGQDEGME